MSLGAINNPFKFPPELIQHAAKFVADDPSTDDETLKACSLTFKDLTRRFQHALSSRNAEPEIIISKDYPDDLYNKKLQDLLLILKANPLFAAAVARVKITITSNDDGQVDTLLPDDSEVYALLSQLTKVSSFSIGSESVDNMDWPPTTEDLLPWTHIPRKLRTVLQGVIQSPLLRTLEIRRMSVPWLSFFGSRKALDRLSLRNVLAEAGSGIPRMLPTSIAIRHLDACQWSATDLVKAMTHLTDPPIHLGKIQTLEVHVPRVDKFGADFGDVAALLDQAELKIQELIVRTHEEVYDQTGTSLFEPEQTCLPNLERLELAFAVEESGDGVNNGCDPFEPWVEAFGNFPEDNKLKSLMLKVGMWAGVYPSVGKWKGLVQSLGRERFPRLQKVHIIGVFPREDASWLGDLKGKREASRDVQTKSDQAKIAHFTDIVAELRKEIQRNYLYEFEVGFEVEDLP